MTYEEWEKSLPAGKTITPQVAWEAAKPKWQPINTAPLRYKKTFGAHGIEHLELVSGLLLLWDCDVFVGRFDEYDGWLSVASGQPLQPTHWMPLPERLEDEK